MKVINPENGFLAYQKIFSNLQANRYTLVIWQLNPESGKREINDSYLNSFRMDSMMLYLDLCEGAKVEMDLPLYCYSEDEQLIFKTSIHEIRKKMFTVIVPSEIRLLEEDERNAIKKQLGMDLNPNILKVKGPTGGPEFHGGYMVVKSMAQRSSRDQEFLTGEFAPEVSLEEEEKMYAGKRASPRARPKADKWVKMKLPDSDTIHKLKLFDLSQGGMSFITFDSQMFPKGSEIYLVGIANHELDDPLVGKIMSHRPVDEIQIEWKVGVKFDAGQS